LHDDSAAISAASLANGPIGASRDRSSCRPRATADYARGSTIS
jgi:hypothetical protein